MAAPNTYSLPRYPLPLRATPLAPTATGRLPCGEEDTWWSKAIVWPSLREMVLTIVALHHQSSPRNQRVPWAGLLGSQIPM
ncbi:MAG: hypothetical protein JXB07_06905 [Anaerolineae bacterium]|nr:hypothetical protein [Anaerolineae bacterium]